MRTNRPILMGITMAALFSFSLVNSYFAECSETKYSLSTDDGLRLDLSDQGQVTGCWIGNDPLAMTGQGGFFIADYKRQPEPVNMLSNPGFEDGFEGWYCHSPGFQFIDSSVYHNGAASACIRITKDDGENSSSVTRLLAVKPNAKYRVSFWTMRENCAKIPNTYISEIDAAGNFIDPQIYVESGPVADNEWLFVSKDITTGPDTAEILVRTGIYQSTGTVWLDDFSVTEDKKEYIPVPGAVTDVTGNRLSFVNRIDDEQIEIRATATGGTDKIIIEGAIRNLLSAEGGTRNFSREERSIALSFRLPFDAAGWTWFDDNEESRIIGEDGIYQYVTPNVNPVLAGDGICSIYPYATVINGDRGLAWGIPLEKGPRIYTLGYDSAGKYMFVTFYFGLTAPGERHDTATFSFTIFRNLNPGWGMRAALERYYAFYPDSFKKRPTYEAYLNYTGAEKFIESTHQLELKPGGRRIEDASDFGEGYKFLYHFGGCYHYIFYPTNDSSEMPSDEDVLQFLNERVELEKEHPELAPYLPTSALLEKINKGADGKILYIEDTGWKAFNPNGPDGWGLNFYVNEDPGISDALKLKIQDRLNSYSSMYPGHEPFSACITGDAIEGYYGVGRRPSYRPEHMAASDVPLTFGCTNLEPAIANGIYSFHKNVLWPLSEEAQVVVCGNSNRYTQSFTLPFVDIPMMESDWDIGHPGRLERYMRSMLHNKIWRFWYNTSYPWSPATGDSIRYFFNRGLAYAAYPAVSTMEDADIETYRSLYRRYVPAIEKLNSAGWEPIPYVETDDAYVVVERYGSFNSENLFFTLRNYADDSKTVRVIFDAAGLGIPEKQIPGLYAYRLLDGNPIELVEDPLSLDTTVEGNGASAFGIGTAEGLARYALLEVDKGMNRVERLFGSELKSKKSRGNYTLSKITQLRQMIKRNIKSDDLLLSHFKAQQILDLLRSYMATTAPVDLAKLFFRMKSDLSQGTMALLNVDVVCEPVTEAFAGGEAVASMEIANHGVLPLSISEVEIISPWREVSHANRGAVVLPPVITPGERGVYTIKLSLPEAPRRSLLPFLICIKGSVDGKEFQVCRVIDVNIVSPIVKIR